MASSEAQAVDDFTQYKKDVFHILSSWGCHSDYAMWEGGREHLQRLHKDLVAFWVKRNEQEHVSVVVKHLVSDVFSVLDYWAVAASRLRKLPNADRAYFSSAFFKEKEDVFRKAAGEEGFKAFSAAMGYFYKCTNMEWFRELRNADTHRALSLVVVRGNTLYIGDKEICHKDDGVLDAWAVGLIEAVAKFLRDGLVPLLRVL